MTEPNVRYTDNITNMLKRHNEELKILNAMIEDLNKRIVKLEKN